MCTARSRRIIADLVGVCPSVCLPVCLSVRLSICLPVCLQTWSDPGCPTVSVVSVANANIVSIASLKRFALCGSMHLYLGREQGKGVASVASIVADLIGVETVP